MAKQIIILIVALLFYMVNCLPRRNVIKTESNIENNPWIPIPYETIMKMYGFPKTEKALWLPNIYHNDKVNLGDAIKVVPYDRSHTHHNHILSAADRDMNSHHDNKFVESIDLDKTDTEDSIKKSERKPKYISNSELVLSYDRNDYPKEYSTISAANEANIIAQQKKSGELAHNLNIHKSNNNFIQTFRNILAKYNIKDDDILENYNLSRRNRAYNRFSRLHQHPLSCNNLNNFPFDPLCAIHLSKYGTSLRKYGQNVGY